MSNVGKDDRHYLYVDGVKVARIVQRDGAPCLQFHDKDKRRCAERGSDKVEVKLSDLDQAVKGERRDGDGSGEGNRNGAGDSGE